jgi:hypothetical protein
VERTLFLVRICPRFWDPKFHFLAIPGNCSVYKTDSNTNRVAISTSRKGGAEGQKGGKKEARWSKLKKEANAS